ncbi:alpha/beta hydrolase [Pseudomonas segetis]|uniref:Serine aminopeptidase S33 domain-containing protein n=1 Tax=Pseudomonas segetis TaxID=298908 RepID=A0A239I1F5_9PSED|nr:alpha/beta fold hydrolase [Pseudomonas segetis]SNS87425.1 hypothetical protein SAMN05216255_3703 [Pseudomonas segetis]
MLRVVLLMIPLLAGLAQAAPTQISQRPVSLQTSQGELFGTLVTPKSSTAIPVALLIAGSGPTDRNGNNPGGGNNDSLRKLAYALAKHGIASLRYDKRGVAKSQPATPDERNLSVERYVEDAVDWSRQLKADKRFNKLVLIGHSEGALIATLAAPHAGADALISIAGSARPIDQVLREQLSRRLPPGKLAVSMRILDTLKAGKTTDDVPDDMQVLFRPAVQPYLISLFRQDPARAFAELKMPALILQGNHDIQVDVADALMLKEANPQAQLALIEGMNHVMRIVALDLKAQLASYNNPKLPLARELTQHITDFIQNFRT